jgi:predicted TIM-barrel fold metal-dependent hydrolase
MIIDAHCHAWTHWPYKPAVPDPESRARVEQLLWEMDRHAVDRAVVICAAIEKNADNNDYVAACVERYPERLVQFADVDSFWLDTYHSDGAAERLEIATQQYALKGFTHYVREDPEWLASEQARRFFDVAVRHNLIASLSLASNWQPGLRELAQRYPTIPFVCHHLGFARVADPSTLAAVLQSSRVPNIHLKVSGFHYASRVGWDYPYEDVQPIVSALYDAYGGERLVWGSDYPVVRFYATYQQALEAFRKHCASIPSRDRQRILGGNMQHLLEQAG